MKKRLDLAFLLTCLLFLTTSCGGGLLLKDYEIADDGAYKRLLAVTLKNTGKDFQATNIRLKVLDKARAQKTTQTSKDGKKKFTTTVHAAPVFRVKLPGVMISPGELKKIKLTSGNRFKAKDPLVKVDGYEKRKL